MRLLPIAVLSLALPGSPAAAGQHIEDNSFLVEEAYNQEPGVIQHISSFQRSLPAGGWLYTFTEEWPAGGRDHQASITAALARSGDGAGAATGIGDVSLNYRYELHRDEKMPVASVVRVSLLLPAGDEKKGLGVGGPGVQVNFPLSVYLGGHFVTHWNVSGTYVPSAWNGSGNGPLTAYAAGQSVIWLARPAFNVMLEALWAEAEQDAPGGTLRSESLTISPGIRSALNFDGGLQIVWGLGVPLGVGPSRGDRAFLLYLSFEHPLRGKGKSVP